jgi:hypothetical protein
MLPDHPWQLARPERSHLSTALCSGRSLEARECRRAQKGLQVARRARRDTGKLQTGCRVRKNCPGPKERERSSKIPGRRRRAWLHPERNAPVPLASISLLPPLQSVWRTTLRPSAPHGAEAWQDRCWSCPAVCSLLSRSLPCRSAGKGRDGEGPSSCFSPAFTGEVASTTQLVISHIFDCTLYRFA